MQNMCRIKPRAESNTYFPFSPGFRYEPTGFRVVFISASTQENPKTTPETTPETLGAGGKQPKTGVETGVETEVETEVETGVEKRQKTSERILQLLEESPTMSLAEVAGVIGKSLSAVEQSVTKLKKAGRLRFVGPRKAGHWEVIGDLDE